VSPGPCVRHQGLWSTITMYLNDPRALTVALRTLPGIGTIPRSLQGVTSCKAVAIAAVTASVVRAAADRNAPLTFENISSIGVRSDSRAAGR